MVKVKICGITNPEDALCSIKAGADALGFNFYRRSPRYISPSAAAKIVSLLPEDILRIGVFVNETAGQIVEIAITVGLNAIQLHGDETPDFVRDLKKRLDLMIIKALRVRPGFRAEDAKSFAADAILLDAFSAAEYGGTGETFDWATAKEVQKFVKSLYLAGGLTPENVGAAIQVVGPDAVDACSSLEKTRGIKDHKKVKAFIENAKRKI